MAKNYYLEEHNRDIYTSIYDYSLKQIYPTVQERDIEHRWDKHLWDGAAQIGLTGLLVSEKYGGQGASCLQAVQAFEAFTAGSGDTGLGLALSAHAVIGTMPIVLFGTEEQKQKYLPGLASGKLISAWGLTEPNSGSDAAALQTRAVLQEGAYLINGSKMFITNGPVGDIFIILARTKPGNVRSPVGISAFIIEKGFSGFSAGKALLKLGMCTSQTSELIFEDVRVEKENLLGPLHSGFSRVGHSTLIWERVVLPATTLGSLRFIFEKSLRYASERKQFNRSIIRYPAIQKKVSMIWVFLQAMTRILYAAARSQDNNINVLAASSLIKILITEMGEKACREAIQILGGYGYIREYDVERVYRDLKLGSIGAGTSEVMRMIASSLLRRHEHLEQCLKSLQVNGDQNQLGLLYGKNLSSECELLQALEDFLRAVIPKMKGVKEQSLAFAYAELLTVYVTLMHSFADCAKNSGDYSVEDKKRDFVLLSSFLLDSYMASIRVLYSLEEEKAKRILNSYARLGDLRSHTENCANFLLDNM